MGCRVRCRHGAMNGTAETRILVRSSASILDLKKVKLSLS